MAYVCPDCGDELGPWPLERAEIPEASPKLEA